MSGNSVKNDANSTVDHCDLFANQFKKFMELTEAYTMQNVNPGGYYKAIWTRDAAYILKDQFISGQTQKVIQEIVYIWSHQIACDSGRVVYGRGSPQMKFTPQDACDEIKKRFEGALPTTIYPDFSEVYAESPDIDSTALMISTTSWILSSMLTQGQLNYDITSNQLCPKDAESMHENKQGGFNKINSDSVYNLFASEIFSFVVPRMLRAVSYLASRDSDDDFLLEQDYNEDWMDTALRAGKIIYSQACWILALKNLSVLLYDLKDDSLSRQMINRSNNVIKAIEQKLWSEKDGSYVDMLMPLREDNAVYTLGALTQDVTLYLIAITEWDADTKLNVIEGKNCDFVSVIRQMESIDSPSTKFIFQRSLATLDAIKNRIWKERFPVVVESVLEKTGPWVLEAYNYHNLTFWPWITGIEILARIRFDRFEECNMLLSKLSSGGNPAEYSLYEWVHPVTGKGNGAYPFRTGISSLRLVVADLKGKST